jgi:hypothetical protein
MLTLSGSAHPFHDSFSQPCPGHGKMASPLDFADTLPILCWYRPTGALAAAAAARGVGIAGGGAGEGVREGGGRLTSHCLGNPKLTRETKKRKEKLHKR